MIATPAAQVKTTIRILDDYAIVPSSKGDACYHVAIEDGLSVHCTCPDHARRSRVCKHMDAVDSALSGRAPRAAHGRDTYEVALVVKPASRKTSKGGALARVEAEVGRLAQEERVEACGTALTQEDWELARAEDEASDAKLDAHDEDSLYYW
jgi:hypothetical protein